VTGAVHAGHAEADCVVARYLRSLDDGDIEATLACFTGDVSYTRPGDGGPVTVSGSAALRELLVQRGRMPWRHHVRLCLQSGHLVLVHGHVARDDGGSIEFLSSATLEDGRIRDYVVLTV
jgi:ketosteroid isomerase-like protein